MKDMKMANLVNYYDELLAGDRDATLPEIQSKLKELKLQLSSRVLRPSSQKEEWLRQLDLIEQALTVFSDQDSRERYDIELRRAGAPTEAEAKEIDWTTRAWNYYFVGDTGAALVASRKAKEQAPKSPMPFVVSAWVQLKDSEWKRAKQDADEAYVLDDEVLDSVDVQMVRGTAYLFMGRMEHASDPSDDYTRALTSFDKALPKASPVEQAEIHWRKSLTFEDMKDYQSVLDAGLKGLSVGVEIPADMRRKLENVTSDAINQLCGRRGDSNAKIKAYETHKALLAQHSIYEESRARIAQNIDQNLNRLRKLAKLEKRRAAANAVKGPTDSQSAIPLIPIAAAVLGFFIMIGAFTASANAGFVVMFIVLGIIVYVVYQMKKRNAYAEQAARFERAQKELEHVGIEISSLPATVDGVIWMED